MSTIMLFGGAFDPPHRGHQQVVQAVLAGRHPQTNQPLAEELWFVPVKHHHFAKNMTSVGHRLAMLEMIVVPQTRIELFEINQPIATINFTINTLEALSKQYPEHQFSWLIGSDNIGQFHKWEHYQQLLAQHPVYVYPREQFPMEPLYPGMIPLRTMETIAVSSTQVRDRLRHHQPIDDLVDPQVAQYISNHGLYVESN